MRIDWECCWQLFPWSNQCFKVRFMEQMDVSEFFYFLTPPKTLLSLQEISVSLIISSIPVLVQHKVWCGQCVHFHGHASTFLSCTLVLCFPLVIPLWAAGLEYCCRLPNITALQMSNVVPEKPAGSVVFVCLDLPTLGSSELSLLSALKSIMLGRLPNPAIVMTEMEQCILNWASSIGCSRAIMRPAYHKVLTLWLEI